MRKVNVVCIMSVMLLLTQCKPSDDDVLSEDTTMPKVSLSGEVGLPNSRLSMSKDGVLSWYNVDHLFYYGMYTSRPTRMRSIAMSPHNPNIRIYKCDNINIYDYDYINRDLYYIGDFNPSDNSIIRNNNTQSGKLEDVGNFMLGKMNITATKNSDQNYTFPTTKLSMYTSVIHIDFPEDEGSKFYVNYPRCIHQVNITSSGSMETLPHPDDPSKTINILKCKVVPRYGPICINGSFKDSYVVVFPQEEPIPNTVLEITNGEKRIGVIFFPNGIRSNKLYVSEDGGALQINKRSTVVEKDLFENYDDLF